jgi:hypothetical protein
MSWVRAAVSRVSRRRPGRSRPPSCHARTVTAGGGSSGVPDRVQRLVEDLGDVAGAAAPGPHAGRPGWKVFLLVGGPSAAMPATSLKRVRHPLTAAGSAADREPGLDDLLRLSVVLAGE